MPQLDFATYLSQLFWLLIFFSLSYALFANVILPRIRSSVVAREEIIEADKREVHKIDREIDSMHSKQKELISHSKKQVEEINNTINQEMAEFKKSKFDEANQKISEQEREAAEKLEKSRLELTKNTEKSSISIAEKIITRLFPNHEPNTTELENIYQSLKVASK